MTTSVNKQGKSIVFGAIYCLLSVALGAFAAHGLKNEVTAYYLDIFKTATDYQMYHGLALILLGVIPGSLITFKWLNRAFWSFNLGIVLFCGSLYLLVLTQVSLLGAITPLGGVAFLIGWLSLALAVRTNE